MLPSVLTAVFFALSTLFAHKSIKSVGATQANIGRLLFAFVVLGFIAHVFGGGMGGAGRNWLVLSGVIGMGLGDLAFFCALPRIGSRLTVLLAQCVAAPIAAVADRLWLGTEITSSQILFGLLILAGVMVALSPGKTEPAKVAIKPLGFLFGLGAAAGQGIGAVVSRKAMLCATQAGETINGLTAAYQRIVGGLLITLAYFAVVALLEKRRPQPVEEAPRPARKRSWKDYLWVPINSSCGAVLGVSCYQWALFTTPSAIVLPIVATTPLVVIPLSYWFEGERPTRRSLIGGVIAVAGAAGLAVAR